MCTTLWRKLIETGAEPRKRMMMHGKRKGFA